MTSLALASLGLLNPGGTTPLGIVAEGYLGAASNQNTKRDGDAGLPVQRVYVARGKSPLARAVDRLWARYEPKPTAPRKAQKRDAKRLVAETKELLHPLVNAEWAPPVLAQIDTLAVTLVDDPADADARAAYLALVNQLIATAERVREEEEIAVALLLAA